MKKSSERDRQLDRTLETMRSRQLPDAAVEAIAARVWAKLAAADPAASPHVDELRPIRSCDDYQALIPAFLDGTLAKSRHLLLESHSRECLQCRRVLNATRRGESLGAERPAAAAPRPYARWALAAALVAAIGAGSWWALALRSLGGHAAIVRSTGGEIYRLAEVELAPLAAGESIDLGERIRTAPGQSAVLELADGSLIEVRGRSLLALSATRRGTTVELERGSVIVQAAPQRDGRLFVATGDCLVSVTGTIFSVNHGTKGSRVSVIEGEVKVDAGGLETVLRPGEQTATHSSLARVPIAQDIAWSRDIDEYIELMREVSDLRRALAEEVPRPALRYASRLLEMVPPQTAFYVALPNLAETVAEADRILRDRVAESRVLKQWLASREEMRAFQPSFGDVTAKLAELGGYLGDEVVVTARLGDGESLGSPLVLAELRDAAGLRRFIEQTVAGPGGDPLEIVFIDDVGSAPLEAAELIVWMNDDTLLASNTVGTVRAALDALAAGDHGFATSPFGRRVAEAYRDGAGVLIAALDALAAGDRGFATSPFGRRVAEAYRDGAGILIAADIASVAASRFVDEELGEESAVLEVTGLLAARHFVMEQKWVGGRAQHRAVLGFDGPRQGMAAWLAAPAPMGSLDFVSPDAKFAAAVVLAEPAEILDDLLRLAAPRVDDLAASLAELEATLGVDLRQDVAAALGGEMALAVDGPLLPSPSWKLVLEVYDPQRAAWVLEQLVAAASEHRRAAGREPLELVREEVGGRAYWSLAGGPAEAAVGVHFTFEDGYLLAAPSRALLDRAIRYRQSGYTLIASPRFRALLPIDGSANFSALFYQDAMSLLEPLAERIAARELTPEQRQALDALAAESGPTLGYAYGEPERIVFAASGTMSLLDAGLPSLLGLGGSFDLDALVESIARGADPAARAES